MKAVIITRYCNNANYGALLQAYALQKTVAEYGFNCEVLSYSKTLPTMKIDNIAGRLRTLRTFCQIRGLWMTLRMLCKNLLGKIIIRTSFVSGNIRRREAACRCFQETIPHSDRIYWDATIEQALAEYEVFICGSDTIWEVDFGKFNPVYWLDFVPCEKSKIAYAPSMGLQPFPCSQANEVKRMLASFDAVSIREKQGKDQLDVLLRGTHIMIHHVVDPTLLRTQEEWDEVCGESRVKGKYIFVYLLGDNSRQRKQITAIAKKWGLKIVTLPYIRFRDAFWGDVRLRDADPRDFIGLIKNAEHVFTDSFHGTIFASLYHKDFFVYRRSTSRFVETSNSRTESLMELLGTPERLISGEERVDDILSMNSLDFTMIDRRIAGQRDYSMKYLENALLVARRSEKSTKLK
jgi:hypothetical protein